MNHYVYKITNKLDGYYYIGVRSCICPPELDPYMGSGKLLMCQQEKLGMENFEKVILKLFDTRSEAMRYEAELVTPDVIKDHRSYNMALGGGSSLKTVGMGVMVSQMASRKRAKLPNIDDIGEYSLDVEGITENKAKPPVGITVKIPTTMPKQDYVVENLLEMHSGLSKYDGDTLGIIKEKKDQLKAEIEHIEQTREKEVSSLRELYNDVYNEVYTFGKRVAAYRRRSFQLTTPKGTLLFGDDSSPIRYLDGGYNLTILEPLTAPHEST